MGDARVPEDAPRGLGPATGAAGQDLLCGRADLMASLGALAAGRDSRPPHSVLIEGSAGAGKTAVLEAAAQSARSAGTRLVWLPGGQLGGAPFALLRGLLGQLADVLTALPEDHQAALLSAAGRQAETVASEMLLGTATLNLLRSASAGRSLLIIVDDVQALSAGAASRLAFIARRLAGSRTRLLLASAPSAGVYEDAADLVIQLPRLTSAAADQLLRQRFPVISAAVRAHLADRAQGNPRALLQLGHLQAADGCRETAGEETAGGALDSESARVLENAAAYARGRGDVDAAAAALRQAAGLSGDPAERARRYAAAACVRIGTNGNLAQVQRSLADARQAQSAAAGPAESLEFVTAECYLAVSRAEPLNGLRKRLVQCLQDPGQTAPDWVVEEAVWVLYGLCWYLDQAEGWSEFCAVTARQAGRLPAWARLAGPMMTGADMSRADLAGEADRLVESLPHEQRPWMVVRAAQVTRYRDHRFGWRTALERLWAQRETGGAAVPATLAAGVLAGDLTGSGDWDTAQALTKSALTMCEGLAHWSFSEGWLLYMSARIGAYRGDARLVRRQTSRLYSWAEAREARGMTARALHCRAIAALADNDPVRAHRHLTAIGHPGGYGAQLISAPLMALDFAEAAVGAGAWADVDELLDQVRLPGDAAGDWRALQFTGAFAVATAGRAGPEADPDPVFRRALAIPGADRWPFDLARIRLNYGERLRAQGRGDDARSQLRLASGTFRHLRALPWLARANDQLSALGDPHDRVPAGGHLTAMEQRIAELAASGLTNREVALQLRVSAGTVSSQLGRLYTKLGVRSRAALRDALESVPA